MKPNAKGGKGRDIFALFSRLVRTGRLPFLAVSLAPPDDSFWFFNVQFTPAFFKISLEEHSALALNMP